MTIGSRTKHKTSLRRGRPSAAESLALDVRIKEEALALFLSQGYGNITMEAVAKAAGVTKRSLYARYADKSELFAEALQFFKHSWDFDVTPLTPAQGVTLTQALLHLAEALMVQALDPGYINMARLAAVVTTQFPETAQRAYSIERSPRLQSIKQLLSHYQEELAAEFYQELNSTAELFLGLIAGLPARLACFGMIREPDLEQQRIQLAVSMFVTGCCRHAAMVQPPCTPHPTLTTTSPMRQ